MKEFKKLFILLGLILFIFGCNEDVTINGLFSGTISNFTAGADNTMQVKLGSTTFGTSIVDKNGKFSMTLSQPSSLEVVSSVFSSLTISDKDAQFYGLDTYPEIITKGGAYIGFVVKTNNFTNDPYSSNYNGTVTWFVYCDRSCSIKGSVGSRSYDWNLKKGWNEVAVVYQSGLTISSSTTIPADLKWWYFAY